MSKAFTKDDDDAPDPGPVRRRGVPVPEGPNYLTPAGIMRLRAELAEADEDRVRELTAHLATAEVIEAADKSRVGFGATVTVEDEDGKRTTYRLVGAIEAAPKEHAISWQSPIANALWDAEIGDGVTLPNGHDVEIVAIEYQ